MNTEERKVMKEIRKHKDLEQNLPAFAGAYMNAAYEYSLIHLVLNYYTVKEIQDESGIMEQDEYLAQAAGEIHTLLFESLLADGMPEDYNNIVERIHTLRNTLTKHMTVLTAYTDALQIYEYVLNRVEFGITGQEYPVEESELAAKVFRYLFKDNDKMVINSKIQMVTGQLPVRMTKSRFFEYLNDTLMIYNGSDRNAVDDFVTMLKSTALLDLPEGFEENNIQIVKLIHILEKLDYKNMTQEEYSGVMEQFAVATQQLSELVNCYLLMMEIINDLYAAVLAMPYERNEEETVSVCLSMLQGLHDAYVSSGEIPAEVDLGFEKIEGIQEMLGEDMLQFESLLQDILQEHEDMVSWMMQDKIFHALGLISKLLSTSLFIDLEKETESEAADADYIAARKDELVKALTQFFEDHSKEVNRAVMAALFSNMPVLFNSQQEIKDYIEYSLNHCSNASELMACARILEDMMEEE